MFKVSVAIENELIREGLKGMINSHKNASVTGEASSSLELGKIYTVQPDVIFIDYMAEGFKLEDIPRIMAALPGTKVIAITELPTKEIIKNALITGISAHLLWCCDRKEIQDCIDATLNNERFYCGKILKAMETDEIQAAKVSCDPISLSERELEIIGLIADGQTNKEIAEKLFLSTHTIMTHRKNIMNKLGVNNTAGIVIYAVKENLISPNKYLFSPSPSPA